MKIQILQNAKHLATSETNRNVHLKRDMTFLERTQAARTREARKTKERLPAFEKRPCSSELTHLNITSEDVKQFFGKLKTSKSPGLDGLHPRVLVELTDQLIEPLKTIFCRSLIEGQLPQDWKDGNIAPIFKKGKRHIPGNYRPISLTSIPCKMLESLVRNAIMEHMESNHLLNDVQHGFVPGRSCSTQLLTVLDDWTSALEDGDNLDALYIHGLCKSIRHCPTPRGS